MIAEDLQPRARTTDVSAHQEQTRRLVRAMMALTGRTASGLARSAGLTPSTVNRFMHRPVRHTLSQRTMLALMTETFLALKRQPAPTFDRAALAELAPAIAVYEKGILEHAPDVQSTLVQAKSALAAGTPQAPGAAPSTDLAVVLAATRDVNVQAGDLGRAPLKTQRPPFLGNDPRAFALLMPDESMMPRFDAGDMLYVSPARALEGEKIDVVAERAEGGFVVGSLTAAGIAAGGDTVRLTTLSPRTRATFARAKLRGVYRIVGVQRLGS
ncbi:MAG: hypothetical protein AB7H70_03085 [Rhodospirillaceae bacterium]